MLTYQIATQDPQDWRVRRARAEALAKQTKGKYSENSGENRSEDSVKIRGVIFKKQDLEKVIQVINDNQQQYRIGEPFYTAKEVRLITDGPGETPDIDDAS